MKNNVRILHVFDKMDRGGAETFIMNIYRTINREKIQFDFVVFQKEKGDYDEEIDALGGHIYHLPKFKMYNYFHFKKSWNLFLKEHPEYKVIHGHAQGSAGIYLKCAKKSGLHTICHSHTTQFGNGLMGIIKKVIQLPIRKYADELFACGKEAAIALYGKKNYEQNNVTIINNSVDFNYLMQKENKEELKKKYQLEKAFVIGHVGRLIPVKNHNFMLDFMKEVIKIREDAVLIFIGKGELEQELKKKVQEEKLEENVIFMGLRSDVLTILKVMDVFVFPSLYEGLPLSLVEAQGTGIRCLISNRVTKDVQISNKVEFLPINDVKLWAERICAADDTKLHFNKNKEKFSVDKTCELLIEKYLKMQG